MKNTTYGFYKLDSEFLTKAHEINNNVMTDAVYLGPVKTITTKRGIAALFVPLAENNRQTTALEDFIKDGIYCNLKFSAMLPVVSQKLLVSADDEIDDETRKFYMNHRTAMEKMADREYDTHM